MTTILVIEDAPDVREIIVDILEAEQFEVLDAPNGQVGIDLAIAHRPDLILCDVMMPEVDGYGVLSTLRDRAELATVPFIFLTAKATKADRRQGMELGADDFLTKPFTRTELLGAIATRLQKQAAITQRAEQKLDELRSSIALSLPHELRTPLNGIIATSQLLKDMWEELDPADLMELLDDIHTSGHRLYRLIQNFLLYAELELIARDGERRSALQRLTVEGPEEVIAQAIATHMQQQRQSDREGDVELLLEPGWRVQISDSALAKVATELLDNALKFSTVGQPVQVIGRALGDRYGLIVCDHGRGMTPDQIENVGAYQQFDRRLYEQQGSGLGLSIVQQMMKLHGGTLAIESVPGEWTRVTVTLRGQFLGG
ncbi:MAG: hybrid sensor histidine kinase/response regulator [Cyanophyceae cyanobacterium]